MSVFIRPLAEGDRADWARLWTGYLDFYNSSVPEEIYDLTFARLLDPTRPQHGFLAFDGTQPVGLVHFIEHPHNWRAEDVVYLQDLYAAPEARGTGVGRALIEAVYRWADDNGTPVVYWLTQEGNQTARVLYDRIATQTEFIKYSR